MNKQIISFSILVLLGGQVYTMQEYRPLNALNTDLAKAVKAADYQEVQSLINDGAQASSLDPKLISDLKYNGSHAKKHGEKPNKYYMTLRLLKQYGVWIGQPYESNVFGDPVLDGDSGML